MMLVSNEQERRGVTDGATRVGEVVERFEREMGLREKKRNNGKEGEGGGEQEDGSLHAARNRLCSWSRGKR